MKKAAALFSLQFAVLKLAAAAIITVVTATSAFADIRVNLNCTINDYSPLGTYTVVHVKSWVSDRVHIEISDSNQVRYFFGSGHQAQGEVKRENSNKIAMEAMRVGRDDVGREFYVTYALQWFKSNGKIFIDVTPQGYAAMGGAKGTCEVASRRGGAVATPPSAAGGAPEKMICVMATENGAWKRQQVRQEWVLEARKRGLTLEDCERVLKAN